MEPRRVLRDRVRIVLVHPLHPGNVGAAARAMANMGLGRLVLVDPPALDLERARWMAAGGREVLEAARFVATVDEALEGATLAVGCTARERRWGWPLVEPDELAARAMTGEEDVAILFGREDHGLDNASLERCQLLLRIPTDAEPSLNLAQAVLLVSAALFRAARAGGLAADSPPRQRRRGGPVRAAERARPAPARHPRADLTAILETVREAVDLLERTPYLRARNPEQVRVTLAALLQRARPDRQEIAILRGMIRKTRWKLDHPGAG